MTPEFIMSRLRWMGNSFRMYLRDTGVIQDKHRDILRAASQEIVDLINANTLAHQTLEDTGVTVVEPDDDMGEYEDDMD